MKQAPNLIQTRYRWRLLRAGPFRLDAGGMFGIIPRPLWEKLVSPDDRNRILLAHNCLLLETVSDAANPAAPSRILIETGTGDKSDEKMRNIYGLEDRSIIDALTEVQCPCEQIDHVIVSHLHFDHAGGLTRRCRENESPDWTAKNMPVELGVKCTFPNATIIVQQREWEDAIANQSTMRRTYLRNHLDPIADQLRLVTAPAPFASEDRPARDESPPTSLLQRRLEVLPGIFVFNIPGHTWGQQAIQFTDERGRTIVFSADLIPTRHHVGAAYNMAYDVEPFTSTITRRWFLQEAMEKDWLLVLDHEPGHPLFRVRPQEHKWFKLVEEPEGA